ncbi:hypothetical protein SAMN05660337_2712 [Maridesulfovibrio ferrireducens]|jgi:hypothetical protein|uniref:Uncharacterized protein n=1 Tax=Maridesulfovibrio ferrireducens TaxID=246191 RepID=A0A1G9J9W7_9BACT|nr:hypothetical protein [Maridesulfovibrio ferrireducens]SDL34350.1 hypothetical protein SAMN05660337_2712 [Maridesulfovibrio ferrireducens]
MVVIDGHKKEMDIRSFENLEQVFDSVLENGFLDGRIVTDVLVNEEPFSEIYPNQSEDIETSEIESLEIKSATTVEMASSITLELYKVVNIMAGGGKQVAELFRQADDAEALELYQDLLDVTRDFLGMLGSLRDQFSLKDSNGFGVVLEEFSSLFTEMTEVLENEDWILLADLLEYEFLPSVEKWKNVISAIREDIREAAKR